MKENISTGLKNKDSGRNLKRLWSPRRKEEKRKENKSNWVLPETTFYNHFKEAKKTYNNDLQEQKRELEAIRLTEVKKAAQKGVKSKFEYEKYSILTFTFILNYCFRLWTK